MSRLASAAKAHYYPIPPTVTDLIVTHIAAPKGGRILDPCCGKGVALGQMAAALDLTPYGVELHADRAAIAKHTIAGLQRGGYVYNTGFQHIRLSQWGWNLLYLNPPFDYDEADGRLELTALKRTRTALCPSGLLVYVVPQQILAHRKTAEYVTSWFRDIAVYRFPDAYREYRQVVLFGRHRSRAISPSMDAITAFQENGRIGDGLPIIHHSPLPIHDLPSSPIPAQHFTFLPHELPTKQVLAEAEAVGALATTAWQEQQAPDPMDLAFRPLTPMRIGHLVNIIAAGYLNNCILSHNGEVVFIKGQTHKEKIVTHSVEPLPEGKHRKITTRTDRFSTTIVALTPTGDITKLVGASLEAFLETWMPALTDHITADFDPVYRFGADLNGYKQILDTLNQERVIPNTTLRGLMPAQQHAVAALATRLDDHYQDHKDALLLGEMGTGKTVCAPAVASCIGAAHIVVVCPPHLPKKWEREIKHVVPNVRVQHLQTISDVDEFFATNATPARPVYGIIKETTARSGSGWVHACEYVGGMQMKIPKKNKEPEITYSSALVQAIAGRDIDMEQEPTIEITVGRRTTTVSTVKLLTLLAAYRRVRDPIAGMPMMLNDRPFTPLDFKNKQLWSRPDERGRRYPLFTYVRRYSGNEKPPSLKQALQRQTIIQTNIRNGHHPYGDDLRGRELKRPRPYGRAKWPLATYINQKYKRRIDLLIVDECHQFKGHTSDRGYAFGRLVAASQKTLGLTGTVYGGKAETLFSLLYRLSPAMRKRYAHRDMVRWSKQYGVFQEVEKQTIEANGRTSGNNRTHTNVRELPGASPAMVRWLLDKTVFLGLHDMGFALPAYAETPHLMPLSPRMAQMYNRLKSQLAHEMKQALVRGDRSLLAGYLQALLTWVDAPWRPREVRHPRTDRRVAYVPGLPDMRPGESPKEAAIVEKIQAELGNNRKVLLLCQMTDTLDITGEWVQLLRENGIKAAVLKCAPDKREQWIADQEEAGVQVIISHPKRLETGLDLLGFPTIIWLGVEYSVYTVKQANRRSWRIGQTKDVSVDFFAYEGTLQEEALLVVAAKMAATDRIDGNSIAEDSLAEMDALTQSDIVTTLTKIVLGEADDANESTATAASLQAAFADANAVMQASRGYIGNYDDDTPVAAAEDVIESIIVDETDEADVADADERPTEPSPQDSPPAPIVEEIKPGKAASLFALMRQHGRP